MSEGEFFVLMALILNAVAFFFGGNSGHGLWVQKAHSVTQKEHKGRLYWVIEDGDFKKLKHVQSCFDKAPKAREEV